VQTVIDLGEDWELPPDVERPLRRVSPRVPLALLSLVLVAMLGGSALPRYAVVSLFSVPLATGGTYALVTDAVYTAHDGQVDRYRLPDGARKWSAEVGDSVSTLRPMPEAGVVLAEYGTGEGRWGGLVALDARTGRALWRDNRARVSGTPDPHHLVLVTFGEMSMVSGRMTMPEDVRGVEAATGRTIWSRQAVLGSARAVSDALVSPDARPWTVFEADDGATEVLDAATGAVVARARLRAPTVIMPGNADDVVWDGGLMVRLDTASGAVLSMVPRRSIVGDRLFSVAWSGTGSVLDVYDLPTLAHQWSVGLPMQPYTITDCGTVLCAYSFYSLAGIDPRTGTVKWSSSQVPTAYPLPGGRLLAESANDALPPTVLDATSMHPLLTLTGWQRLGGIGDRTLLARDDVAGLRTWFAELDPAGPSLRVFGSVSSVQTHQCVHSDTYLACPTAKNQLYFWRLHPLP
jgi:hypothetical protein